MGGGGAQQGIMMYVYVVDIWLSVLSTELLKNSSLKCATFQAYRI